MLVFLVGTPLSASSIFIGWLERKSPTSSPSGNCESVSWSSWLGSVAEGVSYFYLVPTVCHHSCWFLTSLASFSAGSKCLCIPVGTWSVHTWPCAAAPCSSFRGESALCPGTSCWKKRSPWLWELPKNSTLAGRRGDGLLIPVSESFIFINIHDGPK